MPYIVAMTRSESKQVVKSISQWKRIKIPNLFTLLALTWINPYWTVCVVSLKPTGEINQKHLSWIGTCEVLSPLKSNNEYINFNICTF